MRSEECRNCVCIMKMLDASFQMPEKLRKAIKSKKNKSAKFIIASQPLNFSLSIIHYSSFIIHYSLANKVNLLMYGNIKK